MVFTGFFTAVFYRGFSPGFSPMFFTWFFIGFQRFSPSFTVSHRCHHLFLAHVRNFHFWPARRGVTSPFGHFGHPRAQNDGRRRFFTALVFHRLWFFTAVVFHRRWFFTGPPRRSTAWPALTGPARPLPALSSASWAVQALPRPTGTESHCVLSFPLLFTSVQVAFTRFTDFHVSTVLLVSVVCKCLLGSMQAYPKVLNNVPLRS